MEISVPARVASLPVDPQRGLPVPWFVAWIDGKPDFRVIGPNKTAEAIRYNRCWICGQERGRFGSFVIGPMCSVNRTSAEPPCHHECAVYSAMVCPFLTKPQMRRRVENMPEHAEAAGCAIQRNPGVALVWTTREWKWYRVPGSSRSNPGVLCQIGEPTQVEWFYQGRGATREEVQSSIDAGLPNLQEAALEEGPAALRELDAYVLRAQRYLPAA